MKFANNEDCRSLTVTDKDGDKLKVSRYDNSKGKPSNTVYLSAHGSFATACVRIPRKQALKLAYAIIDELNPTSAI